MEFNFKTVCNGYSAEDAEALKNYGFVFKPRYEGDDIYMINSDNAKVNVNTLEELLILSDKVGYPLMIDRNEITIIDSAFL